ncbi:hypothetical protein Goarm_022370 [Gossypium armourianum]|uniref:Uncharacterized protein n=1 Tax=Gossypium armourianum TaxID=34283 RepID=A0A7J9KFN7_9ROSI|nr:hypothetical protein [Gossypium armourianum]
MAVNRVMSESLPHFKRFYICFEALKRGWKEGCRPILGLDGCFLKAPFKGKMLSASWFLSLLTTNLGIEDGFGYTIISDHQKIAINDILPRVEHRNCVRHVLSN